MSETTVRVPIGLEPQHGQTGEASPPPTPAQQPERQTGFQGGVYMPKAGRTSLHQVRMSRPVEAQAPTPTPGPSQAEALSQQMATLQASVTALAASVGNRAQPTPAAGRDAGLSSLMAHNRYGDGAPYEGQQYGAADDQQPDPLNYDFYDQQSADEFQHHNRGYIDREVQRRLGVEREAQQKTQQQQSAAEWLSGQFTAAEAKFKRDANYKETMEAAISRAANSGWKLPLEDAYLQVSNETEARGDRRGSSFLPKDVKTLGEIMKYRHETGRSGR
jgi:hypothetical protein